MLGFFFCLHIIQPSHTFQKQASIEHPELPIGENVLLSTLTVGENLSKGVNLTLSGRRPIVVFFLMHCRSERAVTVEISSGDIIDPF